MNGRLVLLVVLVLGFLASSVSLVYVQHLRRGLFVELKGLERVRDEMNVVWGQLELEASTWAAQDRIENVAKDELDFRVPTPDDVVQVRR